jgi:hypothetical protein
MLAALGAGGGSFLGSALGQASDVLSAPRRALWSALGQPETGAELVEKYRLADSQSALGQALGLGAELIFDPLALAGTVGGGLLGRGYSAAMRRGAQLEDQANRLLGARTMGNAALAEGNALAQEARAALPGVAADVGRADLAGMAAGGEKVFKQASPSVIQAFEEAGLGVGTPGGGLKLFGRQLPQGSELRPVFSETGELTKAGKAKKVMQGRAPAIGDEGVPSLMPGEREFLMSEAAAGRLPATPEEIARALAMQRGSAGLPQGTLGQAVPEAMSLPMGQMPMREGLREIDRVLPGLMRRLARYELTPLDLGLVGAGGAGALGLGAYLGGR